MKMWHPIRNWKMYGEWDRDLFEDYKPGTFAPLDMPLGFQTMAAMGYALLLFLAIIGGVALWMWLA